jgi:MFS-type transporter involved in bile tolerance (Atg22 family)
MTIGSGIAVAAIWGCVVVSMLSRRVTGNGMVLTMAAATIATIAIAEGV